ncbi:MAG: hypothetical protein HXS52_02210 [Theionarchaea archaeon]|nr:hypothetical protein [Theionarchaea archaeon]MBU7036718.1 hypothetical protein [Theionarchaea archaeon]
MCEQIKIANGVMKASLEGIQDIVGENGLKSILNYGHLEKYTSTLPPQNDELEIPLEDLQGLYSSLRELFGDKGADGIRLRVGKENARRALENRPFMAKSIKMATRLIPENKKIGLALQKFSEDFQKNVPSRSGAVKVELREEDDCFLLINGANFESEDVSSNTPVCKITLGILQYVVEWISGNPHEVKEIECRAAGGSADVFRISKAH